MNGSYHPQNVGETQWDNFSELFFGLYMRGILGMMGVENHMI